MVARRPARSLKRGDLLLAGSNTWVEVEHHTIDGDTVTLLVRSLFEPVEMICQVVGQRALLVLPGEQYTLRYATVRGLQRHDLVIDRRRLGTPYVYVGNQVFVDLLKGEVWQLTGCEEDGVWVARPDEGTELTLDLAGRPAALEQALLPLPEEEPGAGKGRTAPLQVRRLVAARQRKPAGAGVEPRQAAPVAVGRAGQALLLPRPPSRHTRAAAPGVATGCRSAAAALADKVNRR